MILKHYLQEMEVLQIFIISMENFLLQITHILLRKKMFCLNISIIFFSKILTFLDQALNVPVPPQELQAKIIDEMDNLKKQEDKIREEIQKLKNSFVELFQDENY